MATKSSRKKPPAWVAFTGVVLVAAALTLATCQFVFTKPLDSDFRTLADVIGAVMIVVSLVAQSTMVMWDQWELPYSTGLMSTVVVASIMVAIVGADFVVIGALNTHRVMPEW